MWRGASSEDKDTEDEAEEEGEREQEAGGEQVALAERGGQQVCCGMDTTGGSKNNTGQHSPSGTSAATLFASRLYEIYCCTLTDI